MSELCINRKEAGKGFLDSIIKFNSNFKIYFQMNQSCETNSFHLPKVDFKEAAFNLL